MTQFIAVDTRGSTYEEGVKLPFKEQTSYSVFYYFVNVLELGT